MSPKAGDRLHAAGVKFRVAYAGTEFGSATIATPRPGDEAELTWMEFSDRVTVRWVDQHDGTYECQFLVSLSYRHTSVS